MCRITQAAYDASTKISLYLAFLASYELRFASFDDFWSDLPGLGLTGPDWITFMDAVVARAEAHVAELMGLEAKMLEVELSHSAQFGAWVDACSDAHEFLEEAKARLEFIRPFAAIGASS